MTDPKVEQGLQLAEKGLQSKLGINVRLPRDISLDEFGRMLGFAIPHDLETVVRTAVTTGAVAVSSSVTALLAGAGLGSVVPGLGTIVGVAVAYVGTVVADAIVDLLSEPPRAGQIPCEAGFRCPDLLPLQLTPIEYISVAANVLDRSTLVDAQEQFKQPCGVLGPAGLCAQAMRELLRVSVQVADHTPAYMTLVDVDWALSVLEPTAKGEYYNDWLNGRKVKYKLFSEIGGDSDYGRIVEQLQARKLYLQALAAQLSRLDEMSLAELGALRTALLEEVRNFSFCVFASQNSSRYVGNVNELGLVLAAHDMVRGVEVERYNTERAAQSTSSASTPVSDTQACWNLFYLWTRENPELAEALQGRDAFNMVRYCEQARRGEIGPAVMVKRWKDIAHTRRRQYRRRNNVVAAFIDSALVTGYPFSRRL